MKLSNYLRNNKLKLIKTLFCYLTFFSFGGCSTLLGSSLLDLQIRLGVSFKKLSSLVPSRSIGFFIGGLISGFLDMCFGPDMVLFVTIFSAGVFTILEPWFKQFYGIYACLLLSGLAQGIFAIYTNICVLSTWNDEASNYVQLLHGSFGLGSLLAPLLIKPFLLPLAQDGNGTQSDESTLGLGSSTSPFLVKPFLLPLVQDVNRTQSVEETFGWEPLPDIHKPSLSLCDLNEIETQSDEAILGDYTPDDVKVQYPYLILGSILVFASFGFLFFHFKNKSIQNKNSSTDVEIVDDDHSVLKKIFAVTIVAYIAQATFRVEQVIGFSGIWAPAIVVKSDLRMTIQNGASLVSAFWFCFTFYSIIFTVLTRFINERRIIICNCILSLIGIILLCFYSSQSQVITWISFTFLGIGFSPAFSYSLVLLHKYITVSNRWAAFLCILASAGELTHPWFICNFLDIICSTPLVYYAVGLSFIQVISVLSLSPTCQRLFKSKTTSNTLFNEIIGQIYDWTN